MADGMGAEREVVPGGGLGVTVRVIDSIRPDGAKLVELAPASALALRALQPDLRLVPVVYYSPALAPRPQVEAAVAGVGPEGVGPQGEGVSPTVTITVKVVSKQGRAPIPGAIVVAFTNFAARSGAQGVTDANGEAELLVGLVSSIAVERLYVYPPMGHWSLLKKRVTLSNGKQIILQPLDLSAPDGLRHYYGNDPETAGAGVKVGVIDTGVANHPDLVVQGGANTVPGEDPRDFGDNGEHHGTHVAGIIAARGTPPTGVRGVAPAVTLRSYRVFGQGSGQASNFAIAKAIDLAVADGCDLLNLSLGGGPSDDVMKAAVEDARSRGSLCIIAAGNNRRGPVSFPATDAMAMAVSALGHRGTFPSSSTEADEVAPPFGRDRADFIAAFSNVGPEVDLTGPGVGIVSTVPGGYAELSGTSMACPAVTGAAARLLATAPALSMKRDQARSGAIVTALLGSAIDLGFTPVFEGHGLPE